MDEITRFLVADDDTLNIDIMSEYLKGMSSQYHIDTADNGKLVWQMLNDYKTEHYDVVILDNMMPHYSGIDILKMMQADNYLKNIPVIIQSARACKEDVIEGIEAGAFYYLTKPFNEEQFSNVVRNCYRNFHVYRDIQKSLQGNAASMRLLEEATFSFRTLNDVHSIAMLIASACPSTDRSMAGLFELMVNAVEHGNLGIGYETKSELNKSGNWGDEVNRRQGMECYRDRTAQLHFSRKNGFIEITITDEGNGFDWKSYMEFDMQRLLDSHGRGIAIANNISFDDLKYNSKGTEVTALLEVAG